MTSISQLIQQSTKQLHAVSESPRLDAELLLCFILKKDRSFLRAWPEREVGQQQLTAFHQLLERRISCEPVAHIIGARGFWSLDLKVTADTLIPRPDTERLVELALDIIPQKAQWTILDLGTGTGAIALSLAKERPGCRITATDQSLAALDIARFNAKAHQLTNVDFIHSDWFSELGQQQFDLIVSNPPYIRENDPHLKKGDVRFEPLSALTAGADGLDDIRTIIKNSPQYLNPHGALLVEHGYDQADAVCELLNAAGFTDVTDFKDDNGQPRVATGHL